MISSPPERCCTKQKLPNCEVCTYTCKFFVYDSNNPERVFIDHKFDCSIETTGKKIQIPLLRQLSASVSQILGLFENWINKILQNE